MGTSQGNESVLKLPRADQVSNRDAPLEKPVSALKWVFGSIGVAVDELAGKGDANGDDGECREGSEEDAEFDSAALAANVARQERRLIGIAGGHDVER